MMICVAATGIIGQQATAAHASSVNVDSDKHQTPDQPIRRALYSHKYNEAIELEVPKLTPPSMPTRQAFLDALTKASQPTYDGDNWQDMIAQRLKYLGSLDKDWNGFGAEPPSPEALSNLTTILDFIVKVGMRPSKILPSAVGGAEIVFWNKDNAFSIESLNTGNVIYQIKTKAMNEIDILPLEPKGIENILQRARKEIGV